jgi:hypothetical protein
MKNTPAPATVTQHKPPPSLVLKDSLRELRLNAKRSAQALAAEVEGVAVQFPEPLGKPLGVVARAATHALEIADRVVADLLMADNDFRHGDFRLRQPLGFMGPDSDRRTREVFTTQFYWELKMLLGIKRQPDFFIKEQTVYDAYFDFQNRISDLEGGQEYFEKNPGFPSRSSLIAAHAILALHARKPVACIHAIKAGEMELIEKFSALNLQLCAAVVLASEIADVMQNPHPRTETMDAISLADEIVSARMDVWDWAVHGCFAHYTVAREIDFVMRHL